MFRFLFRLGVLAVVVTALAVGWFRMSAYGREDQAVASLLGEGRFVETVHGKMHVIETGPSEGVPILLIHGPLGWAGLWSDTLDYLANAGFRAMAIDLPPMGLSERDLRTDYSRQAQALRLLAFVEAEDIQPVVVAHSFGAGPAVEAMLTQPDSFRGAVLVAGSLTIGQDGTGSSLPWYLSNTRVREALVASTLTNPYLFKWLYQKFVHRKDSVTDAVVATLEYPMQREATTEVLARWLPSFILPPQGAASTLPDALASIAVPVTLIWGREDNIMPPAEAQTLGAALRNAPVFWLPDTGHVPHIESPQAFHETLLNALAVIAASG